MTVGAADVERSLARRAGDDHCIELRLPKGFHGSGGCLRQCVGQGAAASTTRTASVRSAAGEASPTGLWIQTVPTGIGGFPFRFACPSPHGRVADSGDQEAVGRVADVLARHGDSADGDSLPREVSQLV